MPTKITPKKLKKMQEMIWDGKSITKTAKVMGFSRMQVFRFIRDGKLKKKKGLIDKLFFGKLQ